jgi:hypothetical protein
MNIDILSYELIRIRNIDKHIRKTFTGEYAISYESFNGDFDNFIFSNLTTAKQFLKNVKVG